MSRIKTESSSTMPFAMNSFRGKQVLALLRDGDYAHAGEEEAIELTLAAVPKKPDRLVLDAGCGRGGTADYMQRNGWGWVTGIDAEARSIAHAREAYPNVQFCVRDICEAGRQLTPSYEVVTLFDVLYALTDQTRALAALAAVSSRGSPGSTDMCTFTASIEGCSIAFATVVSGARSSSVDDTKASGREAIFRYAARASGRAAIKEARQSSQRSSSLPSRCAPALHL